MTKFLFEVRDGDTIPGERSFSQANIRFDSAGSRLGQGSFRGTVFPDHVPKLVLSAAPSSPYREEALHVLDAMENPVRTFPSIVGKSVPRRLTRYLGRTQQQRGGSQDLRARLG